MFIPKDSFVEPNTVVPEPGPLPCLELEPRCFMQHRRLDSEGTSMESTTRFKLQMLLRWTSRFSETEHIKSDCIFPCVFCHL